VISLPYKLKQKTMKKLILPLMLLLTINSVKSQTTIYGLEWDNVLNVNYFVSVDPATGVITQLDSLSGVQYAAAAVSAFNEASEFYIFTDKSGKIYTVDINNGAILSSPTLTASITELQYDKVSGNYYALEQADVTYLVNVNTTSGLVTRIDSISGVNNISTSSSTYDYNNNLFVFVGDNIIYSIDVSTGATISNPILSSFIHELQLDMSTGTYYGIEHNETNNTYYLVNVNPNTGTVTQIDSIQGLEYFALGTSTLDTLNGLYSILSRDGSLLSIDINTAVVSANPSLISSIGNLKINVLPISGSKMSVPTYNQIYAYPNPVKDQLSINVNTTPTTLKVYDQQGRLMAEEIFYNTSNKVDVSNYKTGIYFFTMSNSEVSETKKIIIN